MSQDITMTDFFCGAGGSSEGAENAGVEVKMAVNHWPLAIETHNTNHPATDHDCTDIRTAHPSRYTSTDIFWASPECTNHSLAKGKARKNVNQADLWGNTKVDPSEERSRATMREVVEFAAYHHNPIVIVENVVDIRYWQHYEDWLRDMTNLGYEYRTLYLNAMFFGVPQSRDRWYTVFWKRGNQAPNLDFRPKAVCAKCGEVEAVQSFKKDFQWGRYGANRQYVYRCPKCAAEVKPPTTPAAAVIDWSLPAQKIGDRKQPLKPKTIERIEAGLRKFADQAVLVNLAYNHAGHDGQVRSLDEPLSTVVASASQHFLTIPPFVASLNHSDVRNTSTGDPLPTVMPDAHPSLAIPPFIVPLRKEVAPHSIDEPLFTVATSNHHALVDPAELLNDCRFRMLEPHELKLAMSFPQSYVILGNKRDQTRQVGNAVAVAVAEWIVKQCVASLVA